MKTKARISDYVLSSVNASLAILWCESTSHGSNIRNNETSYLIILSRRRLLVHIQLQCHRVRSCNFKRNQEKGRRKKGTFLPSTNRGLDTVTQVVLPKP